MQKKYRQVANAEIEDFANYIVLSAGNMPRRVSFKSFHEVISILTLIISLISCSRYIQNYRIYKILKWNKPKANLEMSRLETQGLTKKENEEVMNGNSRQNSKM